MHSAAVSALSVGLALLLPAGSSVAQEASPGPVAVLAVPDQGGGTSKRGAVGALVPANWNPVTDARGFRWDIQQLGAVMDGNNDCFDNGLVLLVNNQQFQGATSQQMTADGKEWVLTQDMGNGLRVTRRVYIDSERGGARYLEVFTNTSGKPIKANVTLQSYLGNSAQQTMASNGAAFTGGRLPDYAVGILTQSRDTSRPSVYFLLGDAKSPVRPNLTIGNHHNYQFMYELDIEPESTAAILHVVMQRSGASPAEFEPFYDKRLIKPDVPEELRDAVRNFRLTPSVGGEPLLRFVIEQAESMKVERQDKDVLLLDAETRLSGSVTGGGVVAVATRFGEAQLPWADVAVLAGGAGIGAPMQVYLRSGESLAGTATTAGLNFESEAGGTMPIDAAAVPALFGRSSDRDGQLPAEAAALLQTTAGERLLLRDGEATLRFVSALGVAELPLAAISYVEQVREPQTAHRVVLTDGTSLTGLLVGGPIAWSTLRFGTVELPPREVARFARLRHVPVDEAGRAALEEQLTAEQAALETRSRWKLAGEALLMGEPADSQLLVVNAMGVETVEAAEVEAIERRDETGAGPVFHVKLRGDKSVEGRLGSPTLRVRSEGGREWTVPVEMVMAFRVAGSPAAAPAPPPAPEATPAAAAPLPPPQAPAIRVRISGTSAIGSVPTAPAPMVAPPPATQPTQP